MTYKRGWYTALDVTEYEAWKIKDKIRINKFSRTRAKQLLTALGCVMIRDEYVLESIWDNGNMRGTMNHLIACIMKEYNWSAQIDGIKTVQRASDIARCFRENKLGVGIKEMILRSYGYEQVVPSQTLPAIWELQPAFYESMSDIVRIKSNIIYNPEEV